MARYVNGRPLLKSGTSRPPKRKNQRRAVLNALETAERQNPDAVKIRQHRLGEIEDDSDRPDTREDVEERSSKKRKIINQQEEQEDVEQGSDFEGGTWHTGVNDEEEEDSELDSDEAFGDSDEEKFADFTFRGSGTTKSEPQQRKKKTKELNLDEDADVGVAEQDGSESEYSDDLGDEAVDLATAWDMDDVEQRGTGKKVTKKSFQSPMQHSDVSGSTDSDITSEKNSDSDTEDDKESEFSVSEDDAGGDAAGLRSFIESLPSSNTKHKQEQESRSRAARGETSRSGPPAKLSAADLLQHVQDPALRQSLKILSNAERSGPEEYKGGIPGRLSAPLAKRQQDRLDRTAAYEKSKETLNRWIDTVKQNRRAEHLSFPLSDPTQESILGQKQLMPTSQSAPATTLEATINEIMEESGMGPTKGQSVEDHEQAFEELAENKMDIEEVKARRAELRKARELMFREEIRAKRIKKIKSKAFRRVHRKERDRFEAQQREALEAAGLLNSDDEREKQDRRRAEERMGARHRESRWAKSVKQAGRAAWDEDARAGVTDLAKRDEDLRRRILGKKSANSDVESESETDTDADTDVEDQKFHEKLNSLDSVTNMGSTSKLGQMAFMQRAEAARKAENDEQLRQLRLAMEDGAGNVAEGDEEYEEPVGRQKFGTNAQTQPVVQQRKPKTEFDAQLSDDADEYTDEHILVKANEVQAGKSGAREPRANRQQSGFHEAQSKRNEPAKITGGLHGSSKDNKRIAKRPKAAETALDDYTSSSASESEAQDRMNTDDAEAALAASIFAGADDAVQDFVKEKAQVVEEEGDQVIDNTLPGWGSWAGAGISKREQKKGKGRFLSTIKGVTPDKRQDAKLDRVIINEKRIKKNSKYLASELPHPFESRQQYERSLRLPIGPEWSTTNHYQDSIKPRVLLKQGAVIRPIAKPVA